MDRPCGRDVVRRWPDNPLITIEDLPFRCSDIWNAGVVRFRGEYLLLITIEHLRGQTDVHLARGRDGRHFTVEPTPFMTAVLVGPLSRYHDLGVRDPRVTALDGTYYITYIADSNLGMRVGVARTDDFAHVEWVSLAGEPDAKSGALFPEKINGRYALLERPNPGMSIWISYSDDLLYWGSSEVVMTPRGGHWDADRIGTAVPPIRVDAGWLLIYYGEKHTSAGPLMRLGAAILDADNPARVIARSNIPILTPRENYERIGDVPNMVFSCGAILEKDGEMKIYYGGSDSCICLGTVAISDIISICAESAREF
ncbi:MAG: glycoside hydrolase family 130 protein [Phycisphaerae bacterium]